MSHSVVTKYKITLKAMLSVALTLQRSFQLAACMHPLYAWSYNVLTSNEIIWIQWHSQVIKGDRTNLI